MIKNHHKYTVILTGIFLSLLNFTCVLAADVVLKESNPDGIIISYRPAKPGIDSLYTNNKMYHIFNYDNHTCRNPVGAPLIPVETAFFAAPDGFIPSIEISESEVVTRLNVILAPNPRPVTDNSGFIDYIYEEDPVSYAMSGYKPGSFATLGGKIVIDGIAIWELTFNPVLFDARKSSVAISDGFDVKIFYGAQNDGVRSRRIPDYVINRKSFTETTERNSLLKKTDSINNPFAAGEWYRMTLYENGIYSISGAELEKADFPAGNVSSNEIHMYYGGGRTLEIEPYDITTDDFREIAIKVQDGGDGIFDATDRIIFYGEALSRFILESVNTRPQFQNYPYADIGKGENVYWLVISSNGIPKRIGTTGEIPSDNLEATTTFREFIHIEPENYFEWIDHHNYEAGIEWYWETVTNETAHFSFNAPGRAEGKTSILRLGFRNGMTKDDKSLSIHTQHSLDIKVNDEGPKRYNIKTDQTNYLDIELFNPLKTEKNSISMWRLGSDGNIRLDWLELEYEKELKLESKKLEFFITGKGSPEKYKISNISPSTIEIYDTTDTFQVQEIVNSRYDSGNNTITFQTTIPDNKMYRYTLSAPDYYLKVSSISKKPTTNLRNAENGADYIIITHKDFSDEADRLANWRSRDSKIDPLRTMVVNVDDIYDEFGWGVFDPAAVRDFLKFAWDNYTPRVKYCCFFGDTTIKYKNLSENQIGKNFVPTYTAVHKRNGLTTDDYFAWFDEYHIPYLSIGRLCANDKESAKILVNKTIEYEKNPEIGLWHNRALWIADDEFVFQGATAKDNLVFTENIEYLDGNDYIPQSFERKKIFLIEYPLTNLKKPEVTEDLIAAINDGYIIMNYIGHGNNDVLAHEYILRGSRDIERLNNGARQSLFLIFSCTVGQFDKPEIISLAEMLHLRKDGGCIGVIAPTRVTLNYKNISLNKLFYKNLFNQEINPDYRIGLPLKLGKVKIGDDGNSNRYILFGDPATRLMVPRYSFHFAEIDTIYRLEKLDIHGNITDGINDVPYNGTLSIKAHGPKIHKSYTVSTKTIEYTVPGKIFYNGEIDITGENFDVSFVVPIDLPSDISESKEFKKESKIFYFATDGNTEASGTLENFYVGGIDPEAAEDNTGPEIKLTFDGKRFDEGDYIRRQPALSLEIVDDSGINILGNRGHNIILLIDKTEAVVLTDRFKTINGYNNGTIEYIFPVLSPGEHTFQFTAYDTYNNASKKSIMAQVVGTETGDVTIFNPLNYPNPMSSDGTTFTFSLNDDVRYADIKIYSQSGRLIDTTKLNAGYGFNQVYWKPPVILANGVYFYKISVISMNGRKSSKIEKLVVMR